MKSSHLHPAFMAFASVIAKTEIVLTSLLLVTFALASPEDFNPNYADRLLSPVEDRAIRPSLKPSRRSMPIRVGILPGALVNETRLAMIREACDRWTAATRWVAGGGVKFVMVPARVPGDADIVVSFLRHGEGGTLRGLTVERAEWASITLAVIDEKGNEFDRDQVTRVATHEVGHALGIWGHSPNATDVMSTAPGATEPTLADVNTLRLAYRAPVPGRPFLPYMESTR